MTPDLIRAATLAAFAALSASPATAADMTLDALLTLLNDPAPQIETLEAGLQPYFDLVVPMEYDEDPDGGFYLGIEMVQDGRTAAALACTLATADSLPGLKEYWSDETGAYAEAVIAPLVPGAASRLLCTYQRWEDEAVLDQWLQTASDWGRAHLGAADLTPPAMGETRDAAAPDAPLNQPRALRMEKLAMRVGPLANLSFVHDIPGPAR